MTGSSSTTSTVRSSPTTAPDGTGGPGRDRSPAIEEPAAGSSAPRGACQSLEVDVPEWFVEPSLGRRLGARLLDGLVLAPVVFASWLFDQPMRFVLLTLVQAVYEITFVARDGRTIGKRWLGLQVLDLDTGNVPTLNQAALRFAVPELSTVAQVTAGDIGGLVLLAVFLPILKGPLHRGLHDHAAGTVVTASRT